MENNIWIYWENSSDTVTPEYIKLCHESIIRHCSKNFTINFLNDANVYQFLSIEDYKIFKNIKQINNRSNFLRYTLLAEHGGIWLDSDLVLFKSLKPLLNFLNDEIDLIATASPGLSYGEPECGILISRPGGRVIQKAKQLIDYNLSIHETGHTFKWGGLGPAIIRQAVKGQKYYHLDSRAIQPIPSWEAWRFEGVERVGRYCDENAYGCMLFNEMFRQSRSKFLNMSKEDMMRSNTLLGNIFVRSLD